MRAIYPDPYRCRECSAIGRVVDSKARQGFRWRRHHCLRCGYRWSSWHSLINVAKVIARKRRGISSRPVTASAPTPTPPAPTPPTPPATGTARPTRVSRSRYLTG